jgi:acetate kinase
MSAENVLECRGPVFDTAFHQTMLASAFRYAVPEEWYTRYSVRCYGFHRTSYRFVSERAAALLDRPLTGLRLVVAHLGGRISGPGTAVALVVPTDEDLLIARDTARLIPAAVASGYDR